MEQKQLFHFDLLSPEVSMLNNEKAHLRALGSAGCGLWCLVMGYINVCYLTESPRHISCTVHQPSPAQAAQSGHHQPTAQPMSGAVQCSVRYGQYTTYRNISTRSSNYCLVLVLVAKSPQISNAWKRHYLLSFWSDIFCWWRCNNKFALMFIMYDTIDMENLDANLNHIFVNDYDQEQVLSWIVSMKI